MHGTAVTDGVTLGNDVKAAEPIFVSVDDTALMLGRITRKHVYALIAARDLEAAHIGRRRVITLTSIKAYAQRRMDAAASVGAVPAS